MSEDYERMKRLVGDNIGEIPKIITLDWLKNKYYDNESWFNIWGFSFSDLSNCEFDKNIPYDLKRMISFSTKTIMGDNDYFIINDDMYKPEESVIKLHEEGLDGKDVNVAVIDYCFKTVHNEIKDSLVSYTNMGDARPHFHGSTVSSIFCGKNIGIAPGAKLHFYQVSDRSVELQIEGVIKSLEDIYEKNNQGSNIKVVNISAMAHRKDSRYEPLVEKLLGQGCYVIDCYDFVKKYTCINRDINTKEYYYSFPQNEVLEKEKNKLAVVSGGKMLPLNETENDYKFDGRSSNSWATPVLCGFFTIALQIKPDITFEQFNEIALNNKRVDNDGRTFFDIDKTFNAIKKLNRSINL